MKTAAKTDADRLASNLAIFAKLTPAEQAAVLKACREALARVCR